MRNELRAHFKNLVDDFMVNREKTSKELYDKFFDNIKKEDLDTFENIHYKEHRIKVKDNIVYIYLGKPGKVEMTIMQKEIN